LRLSSSLSGVLSVVCSQLGESPAFDTEFSCLLAARSQKFDLHTRPEVTKLWSAPNWADVGPLAGLVVCVRDIFILNEIWAQDKICILINTLLG
jgi:hypothetical protein